MRERISEQGMGCGPSYRTTKVSSLHSINIGKPSEKVVDHANRGAISKSKRVGGGRSNSKAKAFKLAPGYVILFAVDTYKKLPPLSAAVNDAKSLEKCLLMLGFKIVGKLYNERCTLSALQKRLRDCSQRLPDKSRVVFFFAGHGLQHRQTGRTFYCTANTDPEDLLSTAFDMETIFTLTDFMPYQQAWIMDFCYSGGACMSTVRRDVFDPACMHSNFPSISILTAGRSGETVVESERLTTPTISPLVTPEVTPQVSPMPSPAQSPTHRRLLEVGSSSSSQELVPIPVPVLSARHSVRSKGLFTNCLVRELQRVFVRQRQKGVRAGRQSLTQIFVNVRSDVQRHSRLLSVSQTPQLSKLHWYRQKHAEGEIFF